MNQSIPIDTRTLFKPLNTKLLELLKSLDAEDWDKQTVAKEWKVKDVAGHILDTKLRVLSLQRDGYFGIQSPGDVDYRGLVDWLNQLNADWVHAAKRLSPNVLILMLESVGDLVADYFNSLDPLAESIFPVDWAGESKSYNWMHTAREFTEYWHHQQQIRDAVDKQGIMTKEFFFPVMDTFFQALPHTFKGMDSDIGTVVKTTITPDIGGSWYLHKLDSGWQLGEESSTADATVEIPNDIAWILFSKSYRRQDVEEMVQIDGDSKLANQVLEMVSVMA